MAFDVTTEIREGMDILHLDGKLDAFAVDQFGKALLPLAADPGKKWLVLDFGGVNFIVSAGLRVVLQAVKEMKPRGAVLFVTEMNPLVNGIFKNMGFFSFVTLRETIDDCLREVKGV